MKILIYPHVYRNYGTGNLLRMFELYQYLLNIEKRNDVYLTCNNIDLANDILVSVGAGVEFSNIDNETRYDVLIYDSPIISTQELKELKKITNKLIALDFFEYSNNSVDIIVNLFNHNKEEVNAFQGKIYEGLQYAILKESILKARIELTKFNVKKPNVLITFGGEDPNSNTLTVLEKINLDLVNCKIILGALNKDKKNILTKYSEKVEISGPTTEIGMFMAEADIVICGGGTTLMEAIYIGNPIISIGQNEHEDKFIDIIREKITLFKIDNIQDALNNSQDIEFRKALRLEYDKIIDGTGKSRLYKIIKDWEDE